MTGSAQAYISGNTPRIARYAGRRNCKDSAAVGSLFPAPQLRLGRCLNLLDTEDAQKLLLMYQKLVEAYGERRLPRNTDTGAHYLDRKVIDLRCELAALEDGYVFQTVRGSYPEGDPLFPGSKILSLAHTQIAVRDPVCISQIHRVDFSQARKRKRARP